MKRAFALILASVLLLAAAMTCKIDVSAAEVEKKPFYFSNWDPVDPDEYPNIYTKAYIWAVNQEGEIKVSYGGSTTIEGIAQAM